MRYPIVLWITFVSFVFLLTIAGCSVHSVHDEIYVSDAISERTGHGLRQEKEREIFKLPDGVSLEDGLTQDEAVVMSLKPNFEMEHNGGTMGDGPAYLAGKK